MTGLYDIETERCLLVDMLSRDTKKLEISLNAGLDTNCFFDPKHRTIFRAITDIAIAGGSVDHLELKKQLQQKNQLDEVGIAYLISLYSEVLGRFDTAKHAQKLVTLARERNLISAAENLKTAADSGNGGMPTAVEDLKKAFDSYQSPHRAAEHRFEQVSEDRFKLAIAEAAIDFDVDRLRREHGELIGELVVRCALPGVRTNDGILSIADFNFSSARARSERASLLAKRANIDKLDWAGHLEEFCQRVLAADRAGQPAVDLRELERPAPDDAMNCNGLILPRRHPGNIFGDGGALKSYLAVYVGGCLVQQGLNVALFDWELASISTVLEMTNIPAAVHS